MRAYLKLIAIAVLLALVGPSPARAQLLFNLNPAGLSGAPGTMLSYNATLTNSGTSTLYLNGDNADLYAPGLTLDDTLYYSNFPVSLSGGQDVTADIFTVAIDPSAAPGAYSGTFSIVGGADSNASDVLAFQNFQVQVVPAPCGIAWLGSGLACIGWRCRRRVRPARLG